MHKQHVVEEIQKLMDYEEYMEILVAPPSAPEPDPGQQQQPQPGTSQDDTQSSAVQPPAKKQKPTKAGKSPRRKATDKVKSGPFVEGAKPTAVPRFGDIGRFQAEAYNLCNLQQVIELSEYLYKNGNWELFLTPKNGQCMWSGVRKGVEVPEEFRSNHLRYQVLLWCCQNHGFVFTALKNNITFDYGKKRMSAEEYQARKNSKENPPTDKEERDYKKPGPFSFVAYLQYMLEGSSWGDESMLTCISMMWQITITVVFAEELSQYKIRHQRKLEDADLVLIFAGDSHYLGACKCSFVFIFRCCDSFFSAAPVVSVLRQWFQCCGSTRRTACPGAWVHGD